MTPMSSQEVLVKIYTFRGSTYLEPHVKVSGPPLTTSGPPVNAFGTPMKKTINVNDSPGYAPVWPGLPWLCAGVARITLAMRRCGQDYPGYAPVWPGLPWPCAGVARITLDMCRCGQDYPGHAPVWPGLPWLCAGVARITLAMRRCGQDYPGYVPVWPGIWICLPWQPHLPHTRPNCLHGATDTGYYIGMDRIFDI